MSDAVLNQFTQAVEEEKVSTGRRFKVGIIGTGWIAEAHIESYLDMDDVDVVAMADLIPGRLRSLPQGITRTDALTMYISTRITRSLSTTSLSLMP